MESNHVNDPVHGLATSDGRKSRKAVFRRTIDYNSSAINYLKERKWLHRESDRRMLQSDYLWSPKMLPPRSYMENPLNCVMSKPVRTSTNKNKCPIYCVCWTPEGRRLITGAFSGEFTLWNGLTFNFETILQAHESQIRCMKWSHNEEWLLTADHSGYIKYWQANMNNVEMYQAHKEPIRGVSFCPFDNKFVTCSDDSTVRIWDFHRCSEERVLRGHGSDVRSVSWHPTLSLIISGSKDAQQPIKLWDPKTGEPVTTLYIHKNTCTDVSWNDNGNWFLTASRDHLIKLFDLRNLKSELQTFRGHKRDVMRVAWHPFHESLFCSGGADGSIYYWLVGTDTELGAVENAHESMIWSLAWHPFGHILVSGANDFATKFWTRNRPGDVLKENTSNAIVESLIQGHSTGVMDSDAAEQLLLSNELMKSLTDTNLASNAPDTSDEVAFAVNVEESFAAVEIPGLNEGSVMDFNVSDMDDIEERERMRGRTARSIPKEFAANWASTRITSSMQPVMMVAAPNASALALAAAAAAVNNFTDTTAPQYLPPVKPPSSAPINKQERVNKPMDSSLETQNSRTSGPLRNDKSNLPNERTMASNEASVREPHLRIHRDQTTKSTMNFIGQPPMMPNEDAGHHGPPPDAHMDTRDAGLGQMMGEFMEPFKMPVGDGNHVHASGHNRAAVGQHPRHMEPEQYSHFDNPHIPGNIDRDYRDYNPERHMHPPPHTNDQFYGGPPVGPPRDFDSRPHPDARGPRYPAECMPIHGHDSSYRDNDPRAYEHHPGHFGPDANFPNLENERWNREWLDPPHPPERFGYPSAPHMHPRPPPPPQRIQGPYHPDQRMVHPGGNFPPGKRLGPVGPRHDHPQKYPRPEQHWGNQNQW